MNKDINSEQIVAKEKAEAIITSCTNYKHFAATIPYLELFHKQFKDQVAYNELVIKFKIRKQELNCFEI